MSMDGDNENPDAVAPEEAAAADPRVAALEAELAETRDKLLRALAEGENQRQRHLRQLGETQRFAASELARELLTVADNLGRAMASEQDIAADPAAKGVIEGVAATERELQAVFERHGIKRIEPAPGDKFDHNLHQAMFEVETADQPPGTIAQLLQPGYAMFDRLLRPALVGVSKPPASEENG